MSIEVMSAVWDHSTAYGGDLLILLAIANYADLNGRAYPSIRTLAQRGRMTERNAQYCIKKLEAIGELKMDRNAGPHGTHVFQITLQGANFSGCKVFTHQKKLKRNKELTKETGAKFSGVQSLQTETHFTGGVKPISPEPSLDPSVLQKIEDTLPSPAPADEVTSTDSPAGKFVAWWNEQIVPLGGRPFSLEDADAKFIAKANTALKAKGSRSFWDRVMQGFQASRFLRGEVHPTDGKKRFKATLPWLLSLHYQKKITNYTLVVQHEWADDPEETQTRKPISHDEVEL